jgi:hypothetical protein
MRRIVTIVAVAILAYAARAQNPPPATMTKIEVRLQSPDAPEGSFATLPKTMYRAGDGYCRIEEAPDTKNGIHGLLIVNEPDAWMVNLLSNSARHVVDPGPTFYCHLPIFQDDKNNPASDPKMRISNLEFGRELQYFTAMGAVPSEGPVLQGQQTTKYAVQLGESTAVMLFTYGPSNHPLAVISKRGEKHDIFWYSGYGSVPFDGKLFAKPASVKIEEAQH